MTSRIGAFVLALAALAALSVAPARADVTIQDVQLGAYLDTVVEVDGVVVTGDAFWGIFVQEPDSSLTWPGRQYSGIWVYTGSGHSVQRGDLVNIKGMSIEYFDFSEIDVPAGGGYVQYAGVGTIPAPVNCLITEVNTAGALAEPYESVLIRVDRNDNTLYADSLTAFNEWYVRTAPGGAGDSLLIDQYSADEDFAYDVPDVGTLLTYIQGVLVYNFGDFKLAPRNCETDIGMSCKPKVRGAYALSSTSMNVQFGIPVEEASSEDVDNYELTGSGNLVLTAERDNLNYKLIHLTVQDFGNGQPEQIKVSGVKSEDGTVTMDPNQTFNFRTGITPIYDIQYVATPATNEASPMNNEIVTVQGRVTALEGGYYYLQDGDGTAWRGLYSRVARHGDLRIGDELQVSGVISEYSTGTTSTQLGYRSGVDNWQNFGPSATPVVINSVTAPQIPYPGTRTGRIAERWEYCLVKLNNATVLDSITGVAGPYYGEYQLKQVTSPIYPDTAGCDLETSFPVSYDMCPGNRLNMTGILRHSFGQYRIMPRTGRGGDIVELAAAPGCPTTGVEEAVRTSPMALEQNQPNPFRPETVIRLALPAAGHVNLDVLDVSGRLVKVLLSETLNAGDHMVRWDGTNSGGHRVASGTYFYRLKSDGKELSRKMVLLKN